MKSRKRQNTRRGPGYSSEETDILLSTIQEVLPIGPLDWEQVVRLHTDHFPGMGRDLQSICRKFNKLQASRIPTGDPNCPPAVWRAKRIHRDIEEKMDAVQEMEEQELGFPKENNDNNDDNDNNDNDNNDNGNEKTTTTTNPSTPLFRQPKRAKAVPQEPASSKVEGILSVTKMVADQEKTDELQNERKE